MVVLSILHFCYTVDQIVAGCRCCCMLQVVSFHPGLNFCTTVHLTVACSRCWLNCRFRFGSLQVVELRFVCCSCKLQFQVWLWHVVIYIALLFWLLINCSFHALFFHASTKTLFHVLLWFCRPCGHGINKKCIAKYHHGF